MAGARRGKRLFSYDEALSTFPAVRDLTAAAVRKMEALVNSLASRDELESRRQELEDACEEIVRAWAQEITGAFPRKPSPSSTPTRKASAAACPSISTDRARRPRPDL